MSKCFAGDDCIISEDRGQQNACEKTCEYAYDAKTFGSAENKQSNNPLTGRRSMMPMLLANIIWCPAC
jgi:hypothetical protein